MSTLLLGFQSFIASLCIGQISPQQHKGQYTVSEAVFWGEIYEQLAMYF